MEVILTKIGNSKGIRLPKSILEQINFVSEASLEVVGNQLILTPIQRKPREGWIEKIRDIQNNSIKEENQIENIPTQFDNNEWEW